MSIRYPADQRPYDESYTYDSVGNRLTKVRTVWNPVDVAYSYNARNQLVSSTDGKTYSYDANGNTVSISSAAGDEAMEYDVLNRLVLYEGPSGAEETAYRGAAWHRWNVSELVAGAADPVVTSFLYDGDDVVADYANGTALARLYVTPELDRNLSMTIIAGHQIGSYYYSTDGSNSINLLSTSSGAIANRYDYTAFGEVYAHDSSIGISQRVSYTGRELKTLYGGLFLRYRDYISDIGRFASRDPMGYYFNAFGNLYEYVESRPTWYIDPYGLKLRIGPGVSPEFRDRVIRALKDLCDAVIVDDSGNVTIPCPGNSLLENELCGLLFRIISNDFDNVIIDSSFLEDPTPMVIGIGDGGSIIDPDFLELPNVGASAELHIDNSNRFIPGSNLSPFDPSLRDLVTSLWIYSTPWTAILAHELGHVEDFNNGSQYPRGYKKAERNSIYYENLARRRIGDLYRRRRY